MSKGIKSYTLMERYIALIKQGKKTVEARVAIPMFQSWQEGDRIRFFSRRNSHIEVIVKIVGKAHYKTFRQMLGAEGVEKVIPEISNIYEGERIYLEIPKYAEREKQYGVFAFRIEVI
jgi:ASC-1-like (ASCH) protein